MNEESFRQIKSLVNHVCSSAKLADDVTFQPTKSMINNARRALEERKQRPKSRKGLTLVGVARARDLANGRALSLSTVKRMHSFLKRHEPSRSNYKTEEEWKASKLYIAANAWGGFDAIPTIERWLASVEE